LISKDLIDPGAWPVERRDVLTSSDVWARGGNAVFSAPRLSDAPSFYPVYRMGNLYSHSPIGLVAHVGDLEIDPEVAARIGRGDRRYWSGSGTLDRRISRVGAPRISTRALRDRDEFRTRLVDALCADVAAAEARHAGFTNAILCGGRDSLNLLLLPWKNPVIVLSASSNFALVQRFIADNGLSLHVKELKDEDRSLLDAEVLANMCRLDLQHCRWSGELRAIAKEHGGRIIFWKGQLGDSLLTAKWRVYTHPSKARRFVRLPLLRGLTSSALYQGYFWWSQHNRGGMWQGTHMSLLRDLTGALVLSSYHGPAVSDLLAEVDLSATHTEDLRPLLGERLAGAPVKYPATNPGPPVSSFRAGLSDVRRMMMSAQAAGLRVRALK
jgi:hypothetical protein